MNYSLFDMGFGTSVTIVCILEQSLRRQSIINLLHTADELDDLQREFSGSVEFNPLSFIRSC